MSTYIHPRLYPIFELIGHLEQAAQATGRIAHRTYRAYKRRPVGGTLRPGPKTPLWNELARIAAGTVTRYGEKAKLARFLGVPRQRVHEYLVAKTACPDTERALRMLAWFLARSSFRPAPRPKSKASPRRQK